MMLTRHKTMQGTPPDGTETADRGALPDSASDPQLPLPGGGVYGAVSAVQGAAGRDREQTMGSD